MAEVPPGPNALSASRTKINSITVCGKAVQGEDGDRGCGRGGSTAPEEEQQDRIDGSDLKSNLPGNQCKLPQAQLLNGLISCPVNGLQFSNLQQDPAPKPTDSVRGVAEDCDITEECQADVSLNNNSVNNRNCYDHHQGHRPCLEQNNLLHSNSNGIHNMPTMGITKVDSSNLAGERTHRKESVCRTAAPTQLDDPTSSVVMECEEEGLHGGGRVAASAGQAAAVTSHALVAEMRKLDIGSNLVEEDVEDCSIQYVRYESELQMPDIIRLITKDLSEPYSIYTYRYFIHNWPQLCFLAMVEKDCVGAIVCKLDMHKKMFRRGYIAMLAVDSRYRRKGIGTNLVKKAIYAMMDGDCDEVVLETEITNRSALKLYANLGFVRDKRLFRYYLNGVDALRLKLWLR